MDKLTPELKRKLTLKARELGAIQRLKDRIQNKGNSKQLPTDSTNTGKPLQ